MVALQKANWLRTQRATLKKHLKRERVGWYDLLRGRDDEWEPIAQDMRLTDVLLAFPRVGPSTVRDVYRHLGILPDNDMRLSALTYERRAALAELLREALVRVGDTTPPPPPDEPEGDMG
jgi:hypothetical protein